MTACGFTAHCGRPTGHRGHHGGWRSGVHADTDHVVAPWAPAEDRAGLDLTIRQTDVLLAVLAHGSHAEAATCLGISVQTARNHAMSILHRTGAVALVQVPYVLGWLPLPHHHRSAA